MSQRRAGEIVRRIKSGLAVTISFALIAGVVVYGSMKIYDVYMSLRETKDYIGTGGAEIRITVPNGASVGKIADLCVQDDVVKDAGTFETAARDAGVCMDAGQKACKNIQPGTYPLKARLPAASAVAILIDPKNKLTTSVTIPEGLTRSQLVTRLVDQLGLDATTLTGILDDPASYGLPTIATDHQYPDGFDTTGRIGEGFLFPDTYDVNMDDDGHGILAAMTTRFNQIATQENLVTATTALNTALGLPTPSQPALTPYDVITVASLIEKEVSRDEDRPKVARSIYNRLVKGATAGFPFLNIDSTVSYGLGKNGAPTVDELKQEGPYNTYMNPGLPPTPIANPGKAAIDAALHPAEGTWLYWTTVNYDTGETVFSTTLADQNRATQELKQWCTDNPGKC